MEETKKKKDYLLPASIVIAAVLVSLSLVYNAGKKAGPSDTGGANAEPAAVETPAFKEVSPVNAEDHIVGDLTAPVKIIEYSDFECPFCKRFHDTMQQTMSAYGAKAAWIYRHLPLAMLHSKAPKEAEASECAAELGGNEKFWSFANQLTKVTPANNGLDPEELPKIAEAAGLDRTAFMTCLSSGRMTAKVEKQTKEGTAILNGRPGTPFTVFFVAAGATSDAKSFVKDSNEYFLSLDPSNPPPFSISEDGTMIGMSGALPYTWVEKLMNALLK